MEIRTGLLLSAALGAASCWAAEVTTVRIEPEVTVSNVVRLGMNLGQSDS